jgi:hypothetical protein
MPCNNIEQLFIEHAGLIRNNVSKNIINSDFYLKYLPRDKWLDGQGTVYQYPIYERSLPTNPVSFTNWTSSNGEAGGACQITGQKIDNFGISTRSTQLKKAALNSPDICLDDLRFAWQVEDQIKNVVRVLSENSKYVWTNAYQDEYIAACGNKLVPRAATTGATPTPASIITGSTFANGANLNATSKLTWGTLEHIYEQLGYFGGSLNPFARVDEMTPIYAAVGDRFTFHDLKRQDGNTRDDFRYAYEGSERGSAMLEAPGLNGVYRGFRFFTVEFPPRYDWVGNAWVRRLPFDGTDPTSRILTNKEGHGWEVSAAYKNAAYTDTTIYHADVMKILVPKPVGVGGGMSYNPQHSWTGEFVWRNIPDRECNIDNNTGFFRALFAYGPKIERPDLGFVVRHLRCQRALDLVAC